MTSHHQQLSFGGKPLIKMVAWFIELSLVITFDSVSCSLVETSLKKGLLISDLLLSETIGFLFQVLSIHCIRQT